MKWSRAYINQLPDSAFLHVESGGTFDGKRTHPLTLRHFPYKDVKGRVNKEHLANALARIPQGKTGQSWPSDFTPSLASKIFSRAQALYSREFGYARPPALPHGVTRMPPRTATTPRGPLSVTRVQSSMADLAKRAYRAGFMAERQKITAEHLMPAGVRVRKAR
jgi:hypothetical protein